jgi:hypothetical protein
MIRVRFLAGQTMAWVCLAPLIPITGLAMAGQWLSDAIDRLMTGRAWVRRSVELAEGWERWSLGMRRRPIIQQGRPVRREPTPETYA